MLVIVHYLDILFRGVIGFSIGFAKVINPNQGNVLRMSKRAGGWKVPTPNISAVRRSSNLKFGIMYICDKISKLKYFAKF